MTNSKAIVMPNVAISGSMVETAAEAVAEAAAPGDSTAQATATEAVAAVAEQGDPGLSGAAQLAAANAAALNKPSAEFAASSLEERIEGPHGPVMRVPRLGVKNKNKLEVLDSRARARRYLIRTRAQVMTRLGTSVIITVVDARTTGDFVLFAPKGAPTTLPNSQREVFFAFAPKPKSFVEWRPASESPRILRGVFGATNTVEIESFCYLLKRLIRESGHTARSPTGSTPCKSSSSARRRTSAPCSSS